MCGIFFKYNYRYSYHFPLITSEKLFLSANEDDLIIDGFTVRRFCDVKNVEIKKAPLFLKKFFKKALDKQKTE